MSNAQSIVSTDDPVKAFWPVICGQSPIIASGVLFLEWATGLAASQGAVEDLLHTMEKGGAANGAAHPPFTSKTGQGRFVFVRKIRPLGIKHHAQISTPNRSAASATMVR